MGVGELRRKRLGKEIGLEWRMEHTMRQVDCRFMVGAWGQRGAERWNRLIRDPTGMTKFVTQLRCSMPRRTISYPGTWLNWGREETDQVWWPSRTWRLYGDAIAKVLWAWKLEKWYLKYLHNLCTKSVVTSNTSNKTTDKIKSGNVQCWHYQQWNELSTL